MGVSDPNPQDNAASDTDVLTPVADLAITKTDGATVAAGGQTVTYTIVATNAGPSAVVGASVTDTLPAFLLPGTWTCVAVNGSCGSASGTGNVSTTVDLLPGGTATFTLNVTVSNLATGTVSNVATIAAPNGVSDNNPNNNSATDTDSVVPAADLSITKTDGQATAVPGTVVTYAIVASNAGPAAVVGAIVTDALPATLTLASWTCVGGGGGSCPASGSRRHQRQRRPVGRRDSDIHPERHDRLQRDDQPDQHRQYRPRLTGPPTRTRPTTARPTPTP